MQRSAPFTKLSILLLNHYILQFAIHNSLFVNNKLVIILLSNLCCIFISQLQVSGI